MASPIGTNLTIIAQAMEQRLLTWTSALFPTPIIGDISNIYWIMDGEEVMPVTGQRDILIAEHADDMMGTSIVGASIFTEIDTAVDVYLRSTYEADRVSTRRDFLIAHRLIVDQILDALMGFFPEDASENALTIYGLRLRANATPMRNREPATWGHTVGTYDLRYLPNVSTAVVR